MNKKISFCNKKCMQESKYLLVLEVLIKECQDGSYRILEKSDLLSLLSNKCKMSENELDKIVSSLEKDELISLKYEDEKVYCVCVLPKGTKLLEEQKNKEKPVKAFPRISYFAIFLLSFIASFIACLLTKLIVF